MKKLISKYLIGGYVLPPNVLEAISNGSASAEILQGFGKVMERILPTWLLKAGTYVSPLNYAAAVSKGSINPKIGEEVVSTWHPNLLLVARLGEIIGGGKAIKGTGKAAINATAKAGNKTARAYIISKELNKGVKLNTKNGRIEVTNTYFNSLDKWYRITETPEKYGIMELGKNVTTHDAPQTHGIINGWRSSMLKAPITKSSEGFVKRPQKIEIGIRRKNGQAHGNTSQAAKGKLWEGTTSGSNLFPEGIIEGQAPSMINYGIDRTNFVMTPWELVPNGGRVGFHTGEMPMSNLGWFQRTNKGTYTYESIIPEKRIEVKPSTKLLRVISEGTYPWYRGKQYSVKEVVNSDGTVNPRQAMKILHEVSEQFPGSYKMEHRLENPEWHQNDPTTYQHTKNVARSAWNINPPLGFTKQDLMIAALGHDFGKIVAGDGHALIGADLAKQVFPDLTDAQYTAIAEHMGSPKTPLGRVTKLADISNGREFNYLQPYAQKSLSKHNRKPIYVSASPWEAPDLLEYPEYVKMRGEKLKKIAPDKVLDYTPDINNPLDLFMIQEEGFHPMYKMTPGTNLKALLNENIRRLKAIYGDNFTDAYVQQMKQKGSAPYYLGYFDDSGTSGLHNVKRNLNMIELNPYSKLHTDMMHEGIMHGTDNFLTDYTASLYLNFIDKIINSPEILYKNGVPHYKWLGINTRPVPGGTEKWYEGRSTFGELRKAVYDTIAKNKGTKVTEDTFETLRPEFEKQVDNMSLEDASKALIRTNPYGDVYGNVGPKVNPNFLSEFKGLLKYAPISIPFIFSTDKKKKGGKLCLIKRKS